MYDLPALFIRVFLGVVVDEKKCAGISALSHTPHQANGNQEYGGLFPPANQVRQNKQEFHPRHSLVAGSRSDSRFEYVLLLDRDGKNRFIFVTHMLPYSIIVHEHTHTVVDLRGRVARDASYELLPKTKTNHANRESRLPHNNSSTTDWRSWMTHHTT